MAKIKFTAIVAEMRNSIAGTVFSKNKYGNYARTKVTPVNPQTTYQQVQRALIGNLAASWRGLTDAQRAQWNAMVQNYQKTDIFGDIKILSGSALYVALNTNIEKIGGTRIAVPALPVAIPELSADTYTVVYDISDNDTTINFTIDPAAVPANFALLVFATPGVSAGKTFVKNLYRLLGAFAPTVGVIDPSAEWMVRFGNAIAGQKVYIKIALMSTLTGQMGVPYEIVATATSQA